MCVRACASVCLHARLIVPYDSRALQAEKGTRVRGGAAPPRCASVRTHTAHVHTRTAHAHGTRTRTRAQHFEGYDPEGFSMWLCEYKYPEENTVTYVVKHKVCVARVCVRV